MGSKNKKNKKAAATTAAASVESEPEPKAPDGGGNNRGKKLIADPRFAFSQSDPRFQTHTQQKSKVQIDSRFNRMFTDKNFSTSSTSIDKRGKAKRKDTPNPLKHYYRMDEEDEEEEEEEEERGKRKEKQEVKGGNEEAVSDDNGESENSSDEDEERKSKLKKVWEQLSESESGSELEGDSDDNDDDGGLESDSGDGSSDSDSDSEDEVYSDEEKQEEENIPQIDKETIRLAVVNMDWSQVKAVDLYVLLSSFLPKEGRILKVSVYPSDFGLKRMEEEAVHGPIGLFDDDKKTSESDDEDDEDELDNEKLRAYELSRLKYYYAVVECDSIATADYLYKTCDGVEFERSSNKLDLRFIPDSMEIKHTPRDVATEAPADYEGVDFETRALQQSKIQLTWDEDEPQRSKTLKRKFNADQLAELELKEFLASDESESDEDDDGERSGKRQKKQEMYRALIQSGDGSDGDEEEEGGQDMEVTFNTGLEDISKKILEKRDKESETVWEKIQRTKKEKKKARKNRSKDSSDDDSDTDREPTDEPNDFFIEEDEEEPAIKEHKKAKGKSGKKRQKKEVETAEDEASRAELELLLADNNGESGGVKGYNLKRKKAKKGKGKKGEDGLDEEKIPKVDYEDQRFSSLFTSPLFALDPTDPQFKRSAAHARQIVQKKRTEESNKQSGRTQVVPDQVEPTKDEPVVAVDSSSKKDRYEISSLVKSVKMKSKKVPVPTIGKISARKGI